MKIWSLIVITVSFCGNIQAQDLFTEDFNNGEIPPGWIMENGVDNWAVMPSMAAGGAPGELRLSGEPYFNNTYMIISPEISLEEFSSVFVRFRHTFIPHDLDTTYCSFGLAIRSAGGEWNTAWELSNPLGPVPPSGKYVFLNVDPAQETFQFCFYFQGESSELYDWFIDDILVFNAVKLDAEIISLSIPGYGIQCEYNVSGKMNNNGLCQINAIELGYSIDNGQAINKLIDDVEINFGESRYFSFDEFQNLSSGEHTIKVWVSEVNYLGEDDNPLNDTLCHTIQIASQTYQRKLLFEEFASSSCIPCAGFNENILHPLLESNPGTYALIKYPMNYPYPEDPYYTEAAQSRKDYYGTTHLPKLYTDGGFGTMSQTQYDIVLERPSLVDIVSGSILYGTFLDVYAGLELGVDIDHATLYMALTEKTTTGNIQNNGETEFYNILMNMIPSAEGIPVSGQTGDILEFNYGIDLSDTFIEDFNDLEAIVFLQDNQSKKVFQSSISDITVGLQEDEPVLNQAKVFPNPFTRSTTLELRVENAGVFNIYIRNLQGQVVRSLSHREIEHGTNSFIWDGTSESGGELEPGVYFMHIRSDGINQVRKIIKCSR